MGAIVGFINLDNKTVSEELGISMMNKFDKYKLDDKDYIIDKNIFFGCGIQHITPESLYEKLPKYDSENRLILTADAIIDNRDELFEEFLIDTSLRKDTTDSELILMSYKKWGEDCPKYLVGDFSFVIYDKENEKTFCARDHVGKRTFYYYNSGEVFGFSTLIKPLLELTKKTELNERWIADFLALYGVVHESEPMETIYNNIYQLPAAHAMTVDKDGIVKKVRYWNPIEEVKQLNLSSDEEYDKEFIKVYSEAINCRLRSSGEVGIMLSGGFDSSSVACLAAPVLEKNNRQLKAFTSIPMDGFKGNLPKYIIGDESEYVESIKEKYNNIDVTYCKSEGKNAFSEIDRFIEVLEQPYKIIENLYWLDEVTKLAVDSNCKVLLDGQYGNRTVSFGDFYTHIKTLYDDKKIFKMFKEIDEASRFHNFPKKEIIKRTIKTVIPYKLKKSMYTKKYRDYDRFELSPVNLDLIEKWNINNRFDELEYNRFPSKSSNLKEIHEKMVCLNSFSHIGSIETKISLQHGIIRRDPTRDKRVIEFCLRLPSEQFVRGGEERYLIKRSMKGIIPEKIRLNYSKRGLQSVDWLQRLIPELENIYEEINEIISDTSIEQYLDIDKVKNKVNELKKPTNEQEEYVIRMLLISLVFDRFIKSCEIN